MRFIEGTSIWQEYPTGPLDKQPALQAVIELAGNLNLGLKKKKKKLYGWEYILPCCFKLADLIVLATPSKRILVPFLTREIATVSFFHRQRSANFKTKHSSCCEYLIMQNFYETLTGTRLRLIATPIVVALSVFEAFFADTRYWSKLWKSN